MYRNLATKSVEILVREVQPSQHLALQHMSLGTITYVDARLGMYHLPDDSNNRLRDFLRLRIYHVALHYQDNKPISLNLFLLAKGLDGVTIVDRSIFNLYWLG